MSNSALAGLPAPIPDTVLFKDFLEAVPQGVEKGVARLWSMKEVAGGTVHRLNTPALRLHCNRCSGERTFRSVDQINLSQSEATNPHLTYICGDCHIEIKTYALRTFIPKAALRSTVEFGRVYKYGEMPAFGAARVPENVLSLFGADRKMFLKGRQCENHGLGIGAFSYYRRVVENHKDALFDAIIEFCKMQPLEADLVADLERAKAKTQFSEAIDEIKHGIPSALIQGGGINPLTALHRALSIGIHELDDDECLQAATNVRNVLTAMVEDMALIMSRREEIAASAQALMNMKSKKAPKGPPSPATPPETP